MELNLPKEWFANWAKREGNTDVCAGNSSTEEALRFAASAKPVGPLTPEEQLALETYVTAQLETGCK